MTALQILTTGLVHLCTPGPQTGWPHRVQDQLDRRDRAMAALATAADRWTWWDANAQRIAAEASLARLLDVQPPPPEPFDYDDGLRAA